MKGAFVEVTSAFGTLMPNVIVFQFNPETLRHSWTQSAEAAGADPLGVQGPPGEAFSFTLAMGIDDRPELYGLYPRLAALEKLLFPIPLPTSLGSAPGATGGASANPRQVPTGRLPLVLFVWGTGRILPVRVTGLTISETLFDDRLNPTHAEAQIELRVFTPTEIEALPADLKRAAKTAYDYTQGQREMLALANLRDTAGSFHMPPVRGM